MPDVTFITAAGQPDFTTETRTGDYVVEQVLGAREPTALQISAEFTQTRADYARPAANTTLTYDNGAGADVTAYFVDDVDFQQLGGGVQKWTRLWATIPASWEEPGGTFAFTYPAYDVGLAFGNAFPVTSITANGNYYTCSTNATGISVADSVHLDLNYLRASQNYAVTFLTTAKYVSSGSSVDIAKIIPGFGSLSSVTGTIRKGAMYRTAPETIESDSYLLHEYALADETTLDTLLPQIDRFSPFVAAGFGVTGYATDYLTALTKPTSAQYVSMITAENRIVARRSDRTRYLGNIYERQTLLVKAR